ncbi:CAP domain-containing protein [Jatrophihabitans telluris]|uniref:CAP domain-containing protein n=1 Tax=Jatrophihabitans telluris TaxID=2038343 RepID=A0ABY4R032_9ACTN|nr:CAP domain-containing protein [Jatrophihabitans telluris]UQX88948.1 CAP domain-containing protein [Jatrophihabitans telluris]
MHAHAGRLLAGSAAVICGLSLIGTAITRRDDNRRPVMVPHLGRTNRAIAGGPQWPAAPESPGVSGGIAGVPPTRGPLARTPSSSAASATASAAASSAASSAAATIPPSSAGSTPQTPRVPAGPSGHRPTPGSVNPMPGTGSTTPVRAGSTQASAPYQPPSRVAPSRVAPSSVPVPMPMPMPTAQRPVSRVPRASATQLNAAARSVIDAINRSRIQHGRPVLRVDARLVASAHEHNLTMARAGVMSHQLPNEASLGRRISDVGIRWGYVEENIGWSSGGKDGGTRQALGLQDAMMAEGPPPAGQGNHYSNVLSPAVNSVGIDVSYDPALDRIWLTEDFAQQ